MSRTPSQTNAEAQIELHKALAPRYAYRYSFDFSRLFQEDWHAEMISHVPQGAASILDLGCGTGFFLAELEAQHPGTTGAADPRPTTAPSAAFDTEARGKGVSRKRRTRPSDRRVFAAGECRAATGRVGREENHRPH
jgi:SAM-dependent methyltransferase